MNLFADSTSPQQEHETQFSAQRTILTPAARFEI